MELMTDEIAKKLIETGLYPEMEEPMDAEVIVKYFFPAGAATWLVVGGEHADDDWELFCYATLGNEWEWGSVMLSSLTEYTGILGLKVERDLYCNGLTVKELIR